MAISLTIYILSNIFGLAFQQFAFMQYVREFPPRKRVERATSLALFFFTITLITGLYYYTQLYEIFEKSKILSGEYPLAHNLLVETKWFVLILAPIFSLLFLMLVKKTKIDDSNKKKWIAIFVALASLGFSALNLGTEILIGGAAN